MSFERTLVVALLPFCAMKSPKKKHDLCSKLQTSYTVSLQLGSQQLHSPPQFTLSLHPSLAQITTNQLMQTINKIPLTHTLAQARNCNQANNPLFKCCSLQQLWKLAKNWFIVAGSQHTPKLIYVDKNLISAFHLNV